MLWPCLACLTLPVAFELPDSQGRFRSLREWDRSPVVVVAVLGCECPVARQYAERLNDIARDYGPRGVAIVGVCANAGDSAAAIARLQADLHLTYPVLRDVNQSLAARLGVTRQPEVFVLDRGRTVR